MARAGTAGGWQGSKKARIRWGGGGSCSIRVLTETEWENASPDCLAALFTRPFLVQVLLRYIAIGKISHVIVLS